VVVEEITITEFNQVNLVNIHETHFTTTKYSICKKIDTDKSELSLIFNIIIPLEEI